MTGRIVIVGAGVAGATAAKTLRREGYSAEIVLLGAEDGLPYRRPMVSKEMLAGTADEPRALLESAESWAALHVDVRPATTVEGIDPDRAHVRLADRTEIGYDSLLLATGARPRQLCDPSRNIHTLRARADVAPLRAALYDTGSLLIIGAGLIGCEVAATARTLGIAVTVIHAGPTPLDRIAPPAIGEYYRKLHADNGVDLHPDVHLHHLVDTDEGVIATAADGRTWSAATALVAIGAIPNTDLATAAGLAVDNGILVDSHFRTSAPGIFAAGDAAARYDPATGTHHREEHWNSALTHGTAAAKSILGLPIPPTEAPWGWSIQYGLNLQFAGRIAPTDDLEVHGVLGTPDVTVYARRDDHLVGAIAIGRPADIRAARTEIRTVR
ncbi:FAD-dependent oxidoreductase [Nocardia uniformis]|uniref:FAD-dependent oxidoreductase n=1 Tax=Nocardia uniformis TaxID=53432 RepID=A0A849C782_9NOCA|nr:FAD-dependent oxidoreductase [Nocardia uniformis]NNH70749.1 FAD-dependent oxidoreductase [Nocardia uniformis]